MAVTVYKSDGPTLDGAVKVSGGGPRQARSSQTASSGGPGMESSSPQQSELETVTVGSMPAVNMLAVESNQDGTFGIKTSVADAMPETGPGVTNRNGSASANTNSVITVGVQTGWVQLENGYKYFKEDGSGYKTGWHEEYSADGGKIWYYFDEEPENKEWMVTGWKKIKNGKGILCWYHFREDGKMSRYWVHLKGMWYYLEPRDDAGYMVTDWHIINDEYYYFVPDDVAGYMMIDWFEIRGKWYYFYNSDEKRGIMAHDYLMRHTDGNLYYLQEKNDGSMAVNKEITDLATGIVYYADENGVCTEVILENDLERWMQVVQEISLWYVDIVKTYQGAGSNRRKYYACPLIEPLEAGDDCSGHLNAILVRYGILSNSKNYSSWSYNKGSNPNDKTVINALEGAGFVWYAYDQNCIPKRGDIHVQHNNGAHHVEVIEGYDAQSDSTRIWSWGKVQSSLPVTRPKSGDSGWRTRASGYWRMSGVPSGNQVTENNVGNESSGELFVDIPQDGNLGTFITYMGWHKIKSKSSNQYKLRENARSTGRAYIASPEYYAMVDDRILIATKQDIGGKLHLEIGDYVDVLFQKDGGSLVTYECILGDFKGADAASSWGHNNGRGVVEIIYWDYNPPTGYNKNKNDPWGKGRVIRVTKVGSYYS